jgi:hypothetical protein
MNVRFSLLDIAQRILGATLPNFQWRKPGKCYFRKCSFDGCSCSLNIFSIGWLNKYIGTFIKKSKYVYSLPQRLSRYRNSNLHIGTVKKVCGKFLFFSCFPDMLWFLDSSLIIHEVVKENVISEKPLKKRNFPHTFFLPDLWRVKSRYVDKRWGKTYFDFFMGYLYISLVSQYWTCLNRTLINEFGKVTPKIRCAMFNRLKRKFIMWSNLKTWAADLYLIYKL